jgi:hypothetical protein
MKRSLILAGVLLLSPLSASAQQAQQVIINGDGNTVAVSGSNGPQPYGSQPYYGNDCGSRTLFGALLGGGIGAALSRGQSRWWAIPVGAAVGTAVTSCPSY